MIKTLIYIDVFLIMVSLGSGLYFLIVDQGKPDSKRTAFNRIRQGLQNKGWIIVDNDVYTLTARTPGQSPDKQDLDRGPLE